MPTVEHPRQEDKRFGLVGDRLSFFFEAKGVEL